MAEEPRYVPQAPPPVIIQQKSDNTFGTAAIIIGLASCMVVTCCILACIAYFCLASFLAPTLFADLTRTPTPVDIPTAVPTPLNAVMPSKLSNATHLPSDLISFSPTPNLAAPCDCFGPDLNCDEFGNQAEAQTCYDYCISLGQNDTFRLDGDGDGIACQTSP